MENYPSSEGRLPPTPTTQPIIYEMQTALREQSSMRGMFTFYCSLLRLYAQTNISFPYKNRKTLFLLELNSKRRLVVLDVGFENGGISLGFLYLVVRLD